MSVAFGQSLTLFGELFGQSANLLCGLGQLCYLSTKMFKDFLR